MRSLQRPALPPELGKSLAAWGTQIRRKRSVATQTIEANRLWRSHRRSKTMMRVGALLVQMNEKLATCMYCEHDTAVVFVEKTRRWSFTVEHWEPRNVAPLRTFTWDNLFLACSRCNTILKGGKFPRDSETGNALLLNPTLDPEKHLDFEPSNGAYVPAEGSKAGAETIHTFQLGDFCKKRRAIWEIVLIQLPRYDRATRRGDVKQAESIKTTILAFAFRSVVMRLVSVALGPLGESLTAPRIPEIIRRHHIDAWFRHP